MRADNEVNDCSSGRHAHFRRMHLLQFSDRMWKWKAHVTRKKISLELALKIENGFAVTEKHRMENSKGAITLILHAPLTENEQICTL